MIREGLVYFKGEKVGIIREDDIGITFAYDHEYVRREDARAISFTLPLRDEPYRSKSMIPFFDGLIPEGWLLSLAEREWKIDERDRMSLLLTVCRDTIGAVSVVGSEQNGENIA